MKMFYVLIGDKTMGPYSIGELQVMMAQGAIRWETMYAVDGAREWKPLTDLSDVLMVEAPTGSFGATSGALPERAPTWAMLIGLLLVGGLVAFVWAALADLGVDVGRYVMWLVIGLPIYFIPSWVAKDRAHKNFAAICALNILLGWTFVGWVVALVWALKKD